MAGYLFLRVTGKKAVSQMHTFDLLYIFVLTNIISTPVEVSNVGKAITYAGITLILYKIFIRLSLHNKLRWKIGRASCRERVKFEMVTEDGIRDGHVTGVQTCALPI